MTYKLKTSIAAAIVLWASAFVGIRASLSGYSPEGLALLRYLIASVVMGTVYFTVPTRSHIHLIDKIKLLLVGAIGIGLYNLTLNYGETSVSSCVASFITSQSPVLTTIFAVLFLGESLTLPRVMGFIVSMFGVVLIAFGEIGTLQVTLGMLYIFGALLAGSCYSIMQKPLLKKYNAIEATTYAIWGGTLFLLLYHSHLRADITHAPLSATLTVIYLGVFPASIAYLCWSYVLKNLPVSLAVSYTYVLPFVAALIGWAILNEKPSIISFIGAVIAIAGVWLVNKSYQSPKFPREPQIRHQPDVEPELVSG